jgi:hypothetical protein
MARQQRKESKMIQWVTIVIGVIGLIYNGYKDYSTGQIKSPLTIQQQQVESKPRMPIMYWQVAFDPNTGKLYHLNRDGKWYDGPPQVREYQNQSQEALGTVNGSPGTQGYAYGQSPQAYAYTQGY